MSISLRTVTLTAAALLVLAGCSTAEPAPSTTTTEASTAPTVQTTEAPVPTSEAPSATPEAAPAAPVATGLTLTVGGAETALKLTDVYCKGAKGNIRHIIGKTSNRPPLVEADGTNFTMVKLGQGEPYKAQAPQGVTYTDDGVTFDQVALGSAVLHGTMTCTTFEG